MLFRSRLSATELTGLGMTAAGSDPAGLGYVNVEQFRLDLGSGADSLLVASSFRLTSYAFGGNAGSDRFTFAEGDLDTVQGAITVVGGAANDTLEFIDGGSPGARNVKNVDYSITPSKLTSKSRPGTAPRTFAGVSWDSSTELLTISGTDGVNTFSVVPGTATRLEIDGGLVAPGTVAPRLGDALLVDFSGVGDAILDLDVGTPGAGAWHFGNGVQSIVFRSIERFNDFLLAVSSDLGVAGTTGVRVFDGISGVSRFEVSAERTFGPQNLMGVRTAIGDITGDGLGDLVVASNKGTVDGVVKIFNGRDGGLFAEIRPYADLRYNKEGIALAVGDVDGDGWEDLVVGPSSAASLPIRAFSGNPASRLQRIGQDLVPQGGTAAGVTLAVADQSVNGPANVGRLFVGSVVRGVSSVQSYEFSSTGPWKVVEGGAFQPFGTSSRLTPNLTTGDVNGDGVEDLFVTVPGDARGSVRVFNGVRPGAAILTIAATIAAPATASSLAVNAFDRNGDGLVDLVTSYRSVAGAVSTVSQFNLAGATQKSFVANVLAITDLTGYWMADNRAIRLTQTGNVVAVDDGSRGQLTGTRLTLPSQGRLAGTVSNNEIRWSNGTVWRRVLLDGVWSINENNVQIVQRGQSLWLMKAGNVAALIEWGLSGTKLRVKIDGQFGTVARSADGWEIQWSNGTVSRQVSRSQASSMGQPPAALRTVSGR